MTSGLRAPTKDSEGNVSSSRTNSEKPQPNGLVDEEYAGMRKARRYRYRLSLQWKFALSIGLAFSISFAVVAYTIAVTSANSEPALEVDLDTIEGEIIGNIIEQVRRADCEPVIWWNPTECEIPTCTAYVYQRNGGVGMYKGYGCHLDPEIAMIRAVTEAVQARTIFVAGARDDLLRGSFQALRRSDVFGTKAFDIPKRMVSVNDIPDRSTGFFHGDVQQLLDGLRRLGIEYAFARELELGKQFEISVVRVVVPGLEPYRFPWIRQTDRAHSFKPPVFA